MAIERTNPAGMHQPTGYSHVVRSRGTLVHIAGQVALDADGEVVAPGDLEGQARQVLRNLQTALASAGGGFEHVVKMNTYIVGYQEEMRPVYRAVREEFMTGEPPAHTLIGVQALARPELMIEVEAVAVLDD